ncbi:helix-turn-helix domain protein [Oxobacter pfennigii]|uniref:Helix-turn-helix domain protein n=1 Tax=Oxobacter pfennigii TaxID=36849 RepID=A0A0P8W1B4_9CLOT|nr:helix-turn-helix transcriptional regulator [Oxobacter pfennigii]KPU42196.1 helix-turn-helix domain protein [Oxobacter pfennigii]
MFDKKEIGKKVKQAREIKSEKIGYKFTGLMLANELGLSRSYIGDIEAGRSPAPKEVLNKIIEICGLPQNYFDEDDFRSFSITDDDEINQLEQEFKLMFHKIKKLSSSDRQKILKMIDIFEKENNE